MLLPFTPLPSSPQPSQPPSESLSTSHLLRFPPDLLLYIRSHLPYPDLLALRHTHPYFYYSSLLATDRNIRLKVAWLVDRKRRGLACPGHHRTLFRTDREFCASTEVKQIMARRRRHEDCQVGKECEVVSGTVCGRVRRRQLGKIGRGEVWGIVVAAAAILVLYVTRLACTESKAVYKTWCEAICYTS